MGKSAGAECGYLNAITDGSDINETQQCNVDLIISDDDRNVSTLYDFIHPNASQRLPSVRWL
jgi:hypothetical protein